MDTALNILLNLGYTKDEAKEIRDSVKKKVSATVEKYLIYNSNQANKDIYETKKIIY